MGKMAVDGKEVGVAKRGGPAVKKQGTASLQGKFTARRPDSDDE
jgi:hypothetical protein